MSLRTMLANRLDPSRDERAIQAHRASMERAAAEEPIAFHPKITSAFSGGLANQPEREDLLREAKGAFDAGQRAIANRLASLEIVVKTRKVVGGEIVEEVVLDHPLVQLLRKPHPDLTMDQLMRLAGYWVTSVGANYWLKVGNGLGVPQELHPIPPTQIDPLMSGGIVAGYAITDGDGRQIPIPKDIVVRSYFPDPEQFWTAEGYLAPQATTVDSSKFAGVHMREFYRHDATPKTVVKLSETMKPEAKRLWERWWRAGMSSRSGTSRGTPALIGKDDELIQLQAQMGEQIVPLLEHWNSETLMFMGVPRSVLGLVVSGDRSSAETNQYVFDRHTILPIVNLIMNALTNQLAADFDPSLFVTVENFVSDDKEFLLRKRKQDLDTKQITIDQAREEDGKPKQPHGEHPVGTFADVPYIPSAQGDDFPDDDPDALGDRQREPATVEMSGALVDEVAKHLRGCREVVEGQGVDETYETPEFDREVSDFKRARAFSPDAEWQRQIAREKQFVVPFMRAMRKILKAQRDEAIKRLRDSTPRARTTAEEVFAETNWDDVFKATVEPVRTLAFNQIVGETLGELGGELGGNVDFIFTEAQASMLEAQGARLVKNVQKTTQDQLARVLSKATADGESIGQIEARINQVFKTRRGQARTIARTEVLKASQSAQTTAYDVSGVVEKKQWNHSRDPGNPDHRPSHLQIDGDKRDLNEPFTLDQGELAQAPGLGVGGGNLSAGNAINCRCFLTPVFE